MKKVLAMILCCLMVLTMFSFAGCDTEKKDEAAEAIEKYVTAQSEKDSDTLVELIPPYLYDYWAGNYLERDNTYTDGEIREMISNNHSPIIKNHDYLKVQVPYNFIEQGGKYEDYFHMEYEIMDNYSASKDEVAEFNKYNSEKFSCDVKAESISIICAKFNIIGEDGKDYTNNIWNYLNCICLKIDGKLYVVEATHYADRAIWCTLKSVEYEDKIDWIYEKMTSNQSTYNLKNQE